MTALPVLAALQDYIEELQATSDKECQERYPSLWEAHKTYKFSFTEGGKYFKVTHSFGEQTSVFCFVDKSNGDIYKAETWSRPAKHIRGSIFNENPPVTLGSLYLRH